MPRVVWLTDIHLNFVSPDDQTLFLEQVARLEPAAVLIGGDIAESHDVAARLRRMAEECSCPIYFVLGNHDFYFGSIREVREQMAVLCQEQPRLVYLTQTEFAELAPGTGLAGHDGWADARLGNYEQSLVMLNDYKLIAELAGYDRRGRQTLLQAMGDEAAAHVRRVLPLALGRYPHVVFLTHVPPFRGACWHEGHISNDEWLPHFACRAAGDAMLEVMAGFPNRRLTVLCGHTHSSGEVRPLENIQVLTGSAKYGLPHVQRVFDVE